MDRMQKAEAYRKELGKTGAPALAGTDPELAAIRERLEYGEIAGQGCLDARRRRLITLVVLAFTSKNSRAPKAEGIPYDKSTR